MTRPEWWDSRAEDDYLLHHDDRPTLAELQREGGPVGGHGTCDLDEEIEMSDGSERYWHCGEPAWDECCGQAWCRLHIADHLADEHGADEGEIRARTRVRKADR